ncbi:OLC1v1036749C1 [Oldenlandia corymbosa var. corymbosa]|uniref:OLC1v1036749C1 n=1 Tax=Oldenlandia corymbosa var. corymbosa TaxID=529605 RepID=A0AAV1CZP9_OLDCO|nr:OLC1v1036749C1 [Oldenlandia corymbosa var. corymbosa]
MGGRVHMRAICRIDPTPKAHKLGLIIEFGWDFFKRHQNERLIIERCLMRAVHELYANLTTVQRQFVFVRGTIIEVSPNAIREVLGLPEVDNDWEDDITHIPMEKVFGIL